MSIKPIDIKTNLLVNDMASRIREAQKAQDAGLAENVKQNKDESEHKADSVQKTESTEDKIIRKEDEEEEKKGKKKAEQHSDDHEEENDEAEELKKKRPKIPDGLRGGKIDLKI